MLNAEKEWKIVREDSAKISAISEAFPSISKIASILVNRGIDTADKVNLFINGGIENPHNPFLFDDMQKAVCRIRKAIDSNETILVYGDRDVDGVTAVSIAVNTLSFLGGKVKWYVPGVEGCGIHKDILLKYASENIKVLISVDCGISSVEEIAYAKELGIDVILTDHHEPPCDGVPDAYAIINPKIYGSRYPFKNIAGCVVSLKTMQALMLTYGKEYDKEIIIICFAVKNENEDDFSGIYICLKNDLETKRGDFRSVAAIKQILKRAFRIYLNSTVARNLLIQNDILLKDRIIVLGNSVNNLADLLKAYNAEKFKDDTVMKDFFEENLDLCALGTITDSMPLIDENRIIVKEGLRIIEMRRNAKPGLGLLFDDVLFSKNTHNITAKMISWNVSPMLNSAGRMSKGMLTVELLTTKDVFKARNLYSDITKLNEDRRYLQSVNIEKFKHLLKEQCDVKNDKVLIVKASNLRHGVTGVIATQMVKTYSKPVFLFITDGKEATGTVRSVVGFDAVAALESVKDILVKYGGHNQAAGFTLEHSKIEEFCERILKYADKNLKDIVPTNAIIVEGEVKISDINVDFYKQVEIMEPFGIGNLRPVFYIKNVVPTEVSVFGNKSEHLKFKISQKGSRNIQAVFWNKSNLIENVGSKNSLDIAFHIDIVGRSENKIVQLHVIDIKPVY